LTSVIRKFAAYIHVARDMGFIHLKIRNPDVNVEYPWTRAHYCRVMALVTHPTKLEEEGCRAEANQVDIDCIFAIYCPT
jgi:hypothetical protein